MTAQVTEHSERNLLPELILSDHLFKITGVEGERTAIFDIKERPFDALRLLRAK